MQQLYETKNLSLEDLSFVKSQLKQKIDEQQSRVFGSAKRLVPFTKDSSTLSLKSKSLSPLALITTPLRKGATFSLVEGIVVGYKVFRGFRRVFGRR